MQVESERATVDLGDLVALPVTPGDPTFVCFTVSTLANQSPLRVRVTSALNFLLQCGEDVCWSCLVPINYVIGSF